MSPRAGYPGVEREHCALIGMSGQMIRFEAKARGGHEQSPQPVAAETTTRWIANRQPHDAIELALRVETKQATIAKPRVPKISLNIETRPVGIARFGCKKPPVADMT